MKCMKQCNVLAVLLHENFLRAVVHVIFSVGYGAPSLQFKIIYIVDMVMRSFIKSGFDQLSDLEFHGFQVNNFVTKV